MSDRLKTLGIDQPPDREDRLALIQEIWESIEEEQLAKPLSDAQEAELNRPLAAHKANPGNVIPWEQIESRSAGPVPTMSRLIVFLPEARVEFDQDADWYENRQAGLGAKFTNAVNRVLERIAKNPQMHGVVLEDVRKAVVSGFPYSVFYREEAGNLVVVSVFHSRATRRSGKIVYDYAESIFLRLPHAG